MNDNEDQLRKALENARISFHQGNHFKTRHFAQVAIKINPNIEEPWLWLAAVSSPHASIAYLQKALSINPQSKLARQGMHWAIKRVRLEPVHKFLRNENKKPSQQSNHIIEKAHSVRIVKKQIKPHLWIGIGVLLAVISCALVSPALGFFVNSIFFRPKPLVAAQIGVFKSSNTPTPSSTPTITPSPTPTETSTPTPTFTPTPLPTDTEVPTFTPYPTDPDYPTLEPIDYPEPGEGRWIDIDLSDQITYA
jgi:hypothetical protein